MIGLLPPATGYRSSSASPANEAKSTIGYFVTLPSSISRNATEELSGAHQYAVEMLNSSGYTQSNSPFRISSVPPVVSACSFPSAVLTAYRLCSRTNETHFPSGEIFASAIAAFPDSSTFACCVFKSYQPSAFEPTNKIAPPFGAHRYSAGALRPRPVACVGFDLSSGNTLSNLSALNKSVRSPVAAEMLHNSFRASFPRPFVSRYDIDLPSGVHASPL